MSHSSYIEATCVQVPGDIPHGVSPSPISLSPVEESRIYRAGGWIEFNRVNGMFMHFIPGHLKVDKGVLFLSEVEGGGQWPQNKYPL